MSNGNTFSLPTDYEVMRKVNLAKDKHFILLIQLCFIFTTGTLISFALWVDFPLSNGMNPFSLFLITIFWF
ncbi:hypothetical protein A1A1_07387 [Planococcus antarcticus DSM 14505]|uniref:Uncharacterized protein n=1 Tax=Planococcus antarcticus DSM 14505 TaxID=1185653 RepID=A0A1C7DFH0_9BACL|nr:hypothetical protein BBH88_08235 [Planococcus antarcticus DSM 14505]EIM07202.1 hypothetical protein A1A1_07387 [Planococcus antarcticus DSM 14505]